VYFNAVSIAGMNLAYLGTKTPWLLVAIVALHIETAMQFLPIVRMDGYYILSDLVGVPDLFSRMGPILKSMISGQSPHPRVTELKPWVRRTITLWVAIVVPTLLYWAIRLVIGVPRVLPVAYTKLLELSHATSAAAAAGNIPKTTVDIVQVVLLLLPWTGLLLLLGRLTQRPARLILAHWSATQSQAKRPLSPTQS
jgi:putative peptide zinc metalloprotease protein